MVYKQIGSGVLVSFPPPEDSRPSLLPKSPGPIGLFAWRYRQTNGSRAYNGWQLSNLYEEEHVVRSDHHL